MGWKGLIFVFVLWAFSWLVLAPDLAIMPSWLVDNAELWQLTQILWNVGFAFAFIYAGLKN